MTQPFESTSIPSDSQQIPRPQGPAPELTYTNKGSNQQALTIAVVVMFVISIIIFGYALFMFGISSADNQRSRVSGVTDVSRVSERLTSDEGDKIDTSMNPKSQSSAIDLVAESSSSQGQSISTSSLTSSSAPAIKYVETVAKNSRESGLNWRNEPCGQTLGALKRWGTAGQIMEGPIKRNCLGGDWNWYKIQWFDGSIGWSVGEYMNLSATPLKGTIGRLSGVVDNYQYFVDNDPYRPTSASSYKVCARLIDPTKQVVCTQDYNLAQTREYSMELKEGKYYVEVVYNSAGGQEVKRAFFTTAMECQFKTPESQTCYVGNRQAVVELTGSQDLVNINPVDFSDNARLEI